MVGIVKNIRLVLTVIQKKCIGRFFTCNSKRGWLVLRVAYKYVKNNQICSVPHEYNALLKCVANNP